VNYKTEKQMYGDVSRWLYTLLASKFPNAHIDVRDTHASPLNEYIKKHSSLQVYFKGDLWQTYDIYVDLTAFIQSDKHTGLVFVECKIIPISLLHISQLLGYSRVALPLFSYLISSADIGKAVKSLIMRYDRTDILEYYWEKGKFPRRVIIAKWDVSSKSIDLTMVLPPGTSGLLS
jgi:hypothetical protein